MMTLCVDSNDNNELKMKMEMKTILMKREITVTESELLNNRFGTL